MRKFMEVPSPLTPYVTFLGKATSTPISPCFHHILAQLFHLNVLKSTALFNYTSMKQRCELYDVICFLRLQCHRPPLVITIKIIYTELLMFPDILEARSDNSQDKIQLRGARTRGPEMHPFQGLSRMARTTPTSRLHTQHRAALLLYSVLQMTE